MTLLSNGQFATLYAQLERLVNRSGCNHTLRRTRASLRLLYADYAYVPRSEIIRANVEKIIDLGGLCDCEVLMNVTPSEWEARRDEAVSIADIIGAGAAGELVSRVMMQAVQHTFGWDDGGEA